MTAPVAAQRKPAPHPGRENRGRRGEKTTDNVKSKVLEKKLYLMCYLVEMERKRKSKQTFPMKDKARKWLSEKR